MGGWGGEDMEFPHVLKKEHVEIPGVNFNKRRIAKFPWVLVLTLDWNLISMAKGCHTIQFCVEFPGSESLFPVEILRVKSQI